MTELPTLAELPTLLAVGAFGVAVVLLAVLRGRGDERVAAPRTPSARGTDGYSVALEAQAKGRYSVLLREGRRRLEHDAIVRLGRLPVPEGWWARRRRPPAVQAYHRLQRRLRRWEGYADRLETPGALRADALWRSRRRATRRAGLAADRLFADIARWPTPSHEAKHDQHAR